MLSKIKIDFNSILPMIYREFTRIKNIGFMNNKWELYVKSILSTTTICINKLSLVNSRGIKVITLPWWFEEERRNQSDHPSPSFQQLKSKLQEPQIPKLLTFLFLFPFLDLSWNLLEWEVEMREMKIFLGFCYGGVEKKKKE